MTSTREWLVNQAYPDGRNLSARRSIYAYRSPRVDLPALAVEQLRGVGGPVVDVGCGDGAYAHALRTARPDLAVLALDLSPGMLAAAGHPAVLADAVRLPLASASAGALLAMHMLYHVPDQEAALAELGRVRSAAGVVLIATNAAADKAELFELRAAAIHDVTGRRLTGPTDGQGEFTLEDGQRLAGGHFAEVRRIDFVGEVVVTESEPLVAFVASGASYFPDVPLEPLLERVRHRVGAAIAASGAFRVFSHCGFLVCR